MSQILYLSFLVFLGFLLILGLCHIIGGSRVCILKEFRCKGDAQVRFENKLDKLLKKVTDMEWTFYRKVFNKIKRTDCAQWDVIRVKNPEAPLEPGDIYEIKIDYQLHLKTMKIEDKNGRLSYECTGLELESFGGYNSNRDNIVIIPPKEQLEIYDLFVNYAIYKLDLYQQKLDADERKKISDEHQNLIKEANNKFIL